MSNKTNFENYKERLEDYFADLLDGTTGKVFITSDISKYNKIKADVRAIEVAFNQSHRKVQFIEFEQGRTCRIKLTYTRIFKGVLSRKLKKSIIDEFISENNHLADLISLENEKAGKVKLYQSSLEYRLSTYLYNHATKKYDSQVINMGVGVVIFASHHFFRACNSNRKKINRREEMPNVIHIKGDFLVETDNEITRTYLGSEYLIEMDDEIYELAQMVAY